MFSISTNFQNILNSHKKPILECMSKLPHVKLGFQLCGHLA